MKHRYLLRVFEPQPHHKPVNELRSERNLGHKDKNPATLFQHTLGMRNIDFGFARACYTVDEKGFWLPSFERLPDFRHGTLLICGKSKLRNVMCSQKLSLARCAIFQRALH